MTTVPKWARDRGDALRAARVAAGLTQEELALRLCCSRNTVSNAERGLPVSDAIVDRWLLLTGVTLTLLACA